MALLFVLVLAWATATRAESINLTYVADECIPGGNCLPSDGCVCSLYESLLATKDTPQFVVLSFDDAVTNAIFNEYYKPLLYGRTNRDGTPISATFFVPHEYTDYVAINDLYNNGFEIGTHSITKNVLSSYWQTATTETLVSEFFGQRQIVNRFANIPIDEVVGARTPNLQLAAERTFEAYRQSGVAYDNSWPTLSKRRFFPYTLDFLSIQDCPIGTCPTASFPGMWVLPIIDLVGAAGRECTTLFACEFQGTASEIASWLLSQFAKSYYGGRAPISLSVNAAYFQTTPNGFEGLVQFFELLRSYEDVYIVSQREVLEWMKKPVPAFIYRRTIPTRNAACSPNSCYLPKGKEDRFMSTCFACPEVYPWLDNPHGVWRPPF